MKCTLVTSRKFEVAHDVIFFSRREGTAVHSCEAVSEQTLLHAAGPAS